ncbi:MAG: Crp/Fnr family transcriptional regulator [Candidatus Competibacteraceae bacterium]|nr:Crp/Fnr family transcriptional regulator [Candidatus Competibacteraceae bacterium]HRX72187.1 Crp/Fnr family transcriptional regulator [Candidatus Competibacteraceae bacterium]
MDKPVDIPRTLSNLPLFQQLHDSEIAHLATDAREIRLDKGQILFQKGAILDGFYVVVCGAIKLAFSSPQGNEKVVSIVESGQSFGEAVVFMERPSPVLSQALEDSLLLLIAKQRLFTAIDHDSAFARRMLAGLSIRLHGLIEDVEHYSLRSATQRLIGFLLQLAGAPESGLIELALPASKQVIASRLNLTPETLSRVLHSLSDSGLITVKGRHITITDIGNIRQHGDTNSPCAKDH